MTAEGFAVMQAGLAPWILKPVPRLDALLKQPSWHVGVGYSADVAQSSARYGGTASNTGVAEAASRSLIPSTSTKHQAWE